MRYQQLAEWLAWMEALHPREIDLGLDRVRTVAQVLGIFPRSEKIITVAGTNGKGSFVHSLQTLLLSRKQSVGSYTSPHISRYNERVMINGAQVSDDALCEAFQRIDEARGDISLTYFEFGTLAAFYLFAQAKVAYWVLEVGLGGRLDAVNIIDADIAVITAIGIDHEAWLGKTRESVASEKAGILRAGKVCVCSDFSPPLALLEKVEHLHCDYYQINRDFYLSDAAIFRTGKGTALSLENCALPRPSVAAALQCFSLLGFTLDADLQGVINHLELAGRMEKIQWRGFELIVDVAHNPAAAEFLAQSLKAKGVPALPCIVALMADKDAAGIFTAMQASVSHWICTEIPGMARSAKARDLQNVLEEKFALSDKDLHSELTIEAALCAAQAHAEASKGKILIFGSFYLIAAVKAIIAKGTTTHE